MTIGSERIRTAKISIYNQLALHFIMKVTFLEDLISMIDMNSEQSMRMTFMTINFLIEMIVQ